MRYIPIILTLFLFSCQTVHKAISDTVRQVDSNTLSRKDTSSISLETILSDSIAVHGMDIDISYQKEDSSKVDTFDLQELINHPQRGGNIASVHIHIDSLANRKVVDTKKDSTHVKSFTKADVKTSTEQYSKAVSKTGLPLWIYIAGGIVILLVIGILILKKFIKL